MGRAGYAKCALMCETFPSNDKLPIQNASGIPLTESNFLILHMRKDLNDFPQRDLWRIFVSAQ